MSIPSTVVSGDFYVAISTGSSADFGIYVGLDNSTKNYNSYIFRTIKDKVDDWYDTSSTAYAFNGHLGEVQYQANWMIRVVGSTPTIEIPVTPQKELVIGGMEDISQWYTFQKDENGSVSIGTDAQYSKQNSSLKIEFKLDKKVSWWSGVKRNIDISIPKTYDAVEFWSYVPSPEESFELRVKLHEPNRVRYQYTFRTPADKGCIQHSIPLSEFSWEKTSNEDPNGKLDIERIVQWEFITSPNKERKFTAYIDDVKFVTKNASEFKEVKTLVECKFPLPTTAPPLTSPAPAETPAPSKGICGPTAIALVALLPLIVYSLRLRK